MIVALARSAGLVKAIKFRVNASLSWLEGVLNKSARPRTDYTKVTKISLLAALLDLSTFKES